MIPIPLTQDKVEDPVLECLQGSGKLFTKLDFPMHCRVHCP